MPQLDSKRKQELLDHLVGNCKCDGKPQFSQDDVEVLNKFDLDQLDLLATNLAEEKVENQEEPKEVPKEEPVVNKEPLKFDETSLPESVKEELQFARNMMQKEKDSIVEVITSNKNCTFSKDELSTKKVCELRKIASVVDNEADQDEQPKVTPRLGGNVPTGNKGQVELESLALPVMNFGN